jgi:hypothetical protein
MPRTPSINPPGGLATLMDRLPTYRTVVVAGGSWTRSAGATEALTNGLLDVVNRRGEKDQ